MPITPALPGLVSAVNDVLGGVRNANVLVISDSTGAGYGANGASMVNNDRANSWPTYLAQKLSAAGIYASAQSVIGSGGAADMAAYDNRLSFGAGWNLSSFFGSVGTSTVGGYFPYAEGEEVPATFTPTVPVDTFEFVYLQSDDPPAEWNVSVDGGAAVPLSAYAAPPQLVKHTISGLSLGAHTLTIDRTGGTSVFWAGVIAYNSALKEVSVLNASWSGSTTEMWNNADASYSPINAIGFYAPDVCLINLGINDFNPPTPPDESTFKARYQNVINACLSAGSNVMLIVPTPIGTADGIANQATYAGYTHDLATLNSLPVYDFLSSWGSFASASSNGWTRGDDIHLNAAGYEQMASEIFDFIYQASAIPIFRNHYRMMQRR